MGAGLGLGGCWVRCPSLGGAPLSGPCYAPHLSTDLDQLKEIMKVTGTPPAEFVQRLQSAEVTWELGVGGGAGLGLWRGPSPFLPEKAKNYMKGLPELQKKDFASILTNASPLGRMGLRGAGSVTWTVGPGPSLTGAAHSREPPGEDAGAGRRAAGDGGRGADPPVLRVPAGHGGGAQGPEVRRVL